MKQDKIVLKGVKVHNLKNVDLELDPGQLVVFTGVSGSGKSSLAFDTIYVEGQRRYVESLSTQARRTLGESLTKPDAELVAGISPTIAIEQKTVGHNPRSTVGTLTGIYDYMRVLFARIGVAYCPESGERVTPQSTQEILAKIQSVPKGSKIFFLAPHTRGKKGEFKDVFDELLRKGFMRIRLDGEVIELGEEIEVDPKTAHDIDLVVDRVVMSDDMGRIREATTHALELGKGVMSILVDGEETLFSQHAYSKKSGKSYPPLEPHDFSFNHPSGMCETCQGLGETLDFDLTKIIDKDKSIAEDCCSLAGSYSTVKWGNIFANLADQYDFSVDTPWKNLSERARKIFLHGVRKRWVKMHFVHPDTGKTWVDYVKWKGVLFEAKKRLAEAKSEKYRQRMHDMMVKAHCSECEGSRLRPYPSSAQLGGKTIHELTRMPIRELLEFFEKIPLDNHQEMIGGELIREIIRTLVYLADVGLGYLTLERTAPTLSGGEGQRVRLAGQIGSGLVGATYILDEPSIGLHPADHQKLLKTLCDLRDRGNTVIVVEHDEDTMRAADVLVDVGPGAGSRGGEIIAMGDVETLKNTKRSITGDYLAGRKSISVKKKRRCQKGLKIIGATHHNLKNVSVDIPLEGFVAVTGLSGAGKSSLILDILYPAVSNALMRSELRVGDHRKIEGIDKLDKVIAIDQTPIGRTPRSNPATYIKLFDDIRDLFAKLPESKARGYGPGRFSFNVKEGSCGWCSGIGMIKLDMDFMEAVWKTCEHCAGQRFDPDTLSVTYNEKSIYDVLCMTIEEGLSFFDAIPPIKHKLETLQKVGLEYLTLGQPSTTLSGGEAQRVKLAKELVRPDTGKTLYILDEPTTGLHFEDCRKLINVLHTLVDHKNTVLVIEHNMDLVKTADWVIDIGEGQVIAENTPEKLSGTATAQALHPKTQSQAFKTVKADPITEITVEGAREHNLKNVDITFPRGQISVCTGPSGSGKTSLVFDTVYAEGQRRYIDCLSPYARSFVKQMQKPKAQRIEGLSPAIAIEQKHHAGNPRSTVGTMTEIYDYLRVFYTYMGCAYCPETGEKIQAISKSFVVDRLLELPEHTKLHILAPVPLKAGTDFPALLDKLQKQGYLRIRLNSTYYELEEEIPYTSGRKNTLELVIDRVQPKSKKRLYEAVASAAHYGRGQLIVATPDTDLFFNLAFAVEKTGRSYPPITPHTFSFNTESGACPDCTGLGFQWGANFENSPEILELTPLELMSDIWGSELTRPALKLLTEILNQHKVNPRDPLSEMTPQQHKVFFSGAGQWLGLNTVLAKAAKAAHSSIKRHLTPLMQKVECFSCKGARLSPLARGVRIGKTSLPDLCQMPLSDAHAFIKKLKPPEVLKETQTQLLSRLQFLDNIGLSYLNLHRSAPTLSGGEAQRIQLARQLGSSLTGCLYVLDEPTIGLHPHNTDLLNRALLDLKALGNTLILVEHDPLTMQIADKIVDIGPGAGSTGGQVLFSGTLSKFKASKTLTAQYLSGKKKIPVPEKRRPIQDTFSIKKATLHNLKNFSVDIPLKAFTCITGLSGSGKSTLMHDVLHPLAESSSTFDKVVALTQNPIGTTIRADIATYIDLLTPLRHFFASLPAAQAKGLMPRHFSYNTKSGMCKTCWGLGKQRIELQFLPPVKTPCPACHGYRLAPLPLDITYQGRHLGHILNLTIDEALDYLPPIPRLIKLANLLQSVGLGYLKFSQEVATLSGGEAQRLRLARELKSRHTPNSLYLFDEPTIGLHYTDIDRLLPIFHQLVNKGATLVVIEHNLDILRSADHLIDLDDGEIIAQGTPEQIAKNKTSLTGKYLK